MESKAQERPEHITRQAAKEYRLKKSEEKRAAAANGVRDRGEMMGMKPEIKTDAECVRFCVNERGGRYMLQTKTKVYKLDAQVLAKAWAGQKVKLVGALDPKTNTIAVDKIEREGTSPGSSTKPN